MRGAKISVLGLYEADSNLFINMHVPSEISLDTLINNILIQCAELEILFPNPDFMRDYAIPAWSARRVLIWSKLYETTMLEYNPLYNKDAYYEETEHVAGEQNTSGTTTNATRGFNVPSDGKLLDTDRVTTGGDLEHNTDTTRTRREYGNIGVTSSMQLVKEQREVVDFSVIEYITNDFKKEFCLQIY